MSVVVGNEWLFGMMVRETASSVSADSTHWLNIMETLKTPAWLKVYPAKNKLRWYPQQPQRFIFTNLSEACFEAKRWNLLRNPVEPDLAAPKPPWPSPDPSPEPCWTWPGCTKASQTFSGTFSGTLLNLTWLCTKASQTFSEPSPEPWPCWTWPGSAPKPPRPSPEPSPEPCWTWPGSAPKPPRPSPETSPEPCWTWLGFAPRLPGNFSGNLLRNPVEHQGFLEPSPKPSPKPCCTWIQSRFRNYRRFRNCDSETTIQKLFPPFQKLLRFRNYNAIQKLGFRNYRDSETIAIPKLSRFQNYRDSATITIQQLRFRNYRNSETIAIQKLTRFRNYRDSETIAIQKLSRFRNYQDSEAIAIQKLSRIRNYRASETTIQQLQFRNYHSETIAIQKLSRFRNYHDSETMIQKLSRFRNYRNSETITPMELHWFGMSTRIRWYPNSHPHGTSH